MTQPMNISKSDRGGQSSEHSDTNSNTPTAAAPVAITAKPVLRLIKAAVKQDEIEIKEAALEIAKEFELNGKDELARYIYALYGLVRTFEVTD